MVSFSSSRVRLTEAFVSFASLFGISAISNFRMRVLSVSFTDHVPEFAANARAATAHSSALACERTLLMALNFGRSGRPVTEAYRPLASRHQDALWIGPKVLLFAAVWGDSIVRDERPCSYELLFECLLLAEGTAQA
jgi:hypothetical protein